MFEDLKMLLGKHGFIVGLAKLEGFSMAVTEYGKSRNDHCFIHEANFYKMEKIKCGVVVCVSSGDHATYNVEEGNAAAGVVEFKNSSFAIDHTIAKMIKTAGDLALSVLASKKQINTIFITGIAANYKAQEAKLIKVTVNLIEETSEIVQSRDVMPLCSALNVMLHAISL